MKCEICEKPLRNGDWVCSGLDVPELGFCKQHKKAHTETCFPGRHGNAWWTRIGSAKRATEIKKPDASDGDTAPAQLRGQRNS